MPRYINAERFDVITSKRHSEDFIDGMDYILNMIDNAPTEDVVPRSEVEKWYAEYHKVKEDLRQEKMYHKSTDKLADRYLVELKQAQQKVAKQIFEEIENIIARNTQHGFKGKYKVHCITGFNGRQITRLIAELKKKYIGE